MKLPPIENCWAVRNGWGLFKDLSTGNWYKSPLNDLKVIVWAEYPEYEEFIANSIIDEILEEEKNSKENK